MKAVKSLEHGILLNYFTLNEKYYYPISILTFFSLDQPDVEISEQELWPFVQAELGADQILDMGMPKPKGEALVWGRCFAPDEKPVSALTVSFRAGSIQKSLAVFGYRYWMEKQGFWSATEPKPFLSMPLGWGHAFGGEKFPKNPLGKGMDKRLFDRDQVVIPMPNVEYPGLLVKSLDDRPEPAGFAPLDLMWPQRRKKVGTYDAQWFRERWPYYPDDMDWSFFNVAPEDQQSDGYLKPGDPVVLINMHPKKPLIETTLPRLRHRLFIDQLSDLKKPKGETAFKEIKTRIDTVWLFPHAERGVLITRGVAEVQDEEARDVLHLYVTTEHLAEEPGSIEHHFERFQYQLKNPMAIQVDMSPMIEAEKLMAEAKEKLKDLPLQIKDSIAQNLGEAPKPIRTAQDTLAECMKVVDQCAPIIDDAEKRLLDTKAKFGHMAKIDITPLQKTKADLPNIKQKLMDLSREADRADGEIAKVRSEVKQAIQETCGKFPGDIWPKYCQEKGFDPDAFVAGLGPHSEDPWHESGMRFIEQCRTNLEDHPEIHGALRNLGLRSYHIKRSWLGLNLEEQRFNPLDWGLTPDKRPPDAPEDLIVPAGLIVPHFMGARLNRIAVREGGHEVEAWKDGQYPEYPGQTLVEGSGLEAMILEGRPGRPVVRVADELGAVLLNQELNGLCGVVAMPDPGVPLDDQAAEWLPEVPQFIVIEYPGNTPGLLELIHAWKPIHPEPEALSLFEGQNLYEERRAGRNLRQWIIEELRPEFAPDPAEEIKEEDLDKPGGLALLIPTFNVPAIIEEIREKLLAPTRAEFKKAETETKAAIEEAKQRFKDIGQDVDEAFKPLDQLNFDPDAMMDPKNAPPDDGKNPFSEMEEENKKAFDNLRQQLKDANALTPEREQAIGQTEKELKGVVQDCAERHDRGLADLKAAQAAATGGMPDWAKGLLLKAGFDPDDPNPLKTLTREEVVERYQNGQSMAGKVMTGLDLSGLNLPGVDFRQAQLQGANLTASNLNEADLCGAIAEGADFSLATLNRAKMEQGLFQKANFTEADLSEANLKSALLKGAVMPRANLTAANLTQALLEDADLSEAILRRTEAGKAAFLQTKLPGAQFAGADLSNAFFYMADVTDADLSESKARESFFWQTKGEGVRFADADLTNIRIMGETQMKGADFSGSKMEKSCLMNSDFSGSDFRKTQMDNGIMENCNLSQSTMNGFSAKKTQFNRSDLSGSDLRGSNLMQASLRKVRFPEADLRSVCLYNADVYKIGLGNTKMEGANIRRTLLERIKDFMPKDNQK